jgi:hypothetical protein
VTIGRARRIFKDGREKMLAGGKIGERTPRYSAGDGNSGRQRQRRRQE